MKKHSLKLVPAWSTTVILCSALVFATACGIPKYDINNATDRAAMKIDIRNSLTADSCTSALENATLLYNSQYSDNEARMLYASAHACNIRIHLYTLINSLSGLSSTNPIGDFAKLFPSTNTDSRLASSWYATDALFANLNPGAVVAPQDKIYTGSYNPGSVLVQDRSEDSNIYLMFIGMASIGTALNRYGAPTATYNQGSNLNWETKALVLADQTGVACSLASGFLNFFDGAHIVLKYLSSSSATSLSNTVNLLENQMTVTDMLRAGFGAKTKCLADGFSATDCAAALIRLRYRGACAEQDAAASSAAGMIGALNDLWL